MKIRFCEHTKGKGKMFRILKEEFPDLDVKIKECIKQCGTCRETLIAMVDKKRIIGHDHEDLHRKLLELIKLR